METTLKAGFDRALEKILIVSSEKGQRSLGELLRAGPGAVQLMMAASGNEAKRILLVNDFDLVIINAPLIDENGQELASLVAQRQAGSVLLLVKSDMQQLRPNLDKEGIVVLYKPLNKALFEQAVELVRIMNRRIAELAAANRKLLRQLDELRIIARAKCLLIANCAMTEEEAHSLIEKTAMDRREAKLTIAEAIIKQYKK